MLMELLVHFAASLTFLGVLHCNIGVNVMYKINQQDPFFKNFLHSTQISLPRSSQGWIPRAQGRVSKQVGAGVEGIRWQGRQASRGSSLRTQLTGPFIE